MPRPDDVLADRYQLVGQIARGGMASVWVAIDTRLARRVAIKILDPQLAMDDGLRDRFRREAIAAAGLSHRGIVSTHDTGEDAGVTYIVMELIDGQTLAHIIAERAPLSIGEACDLGAQIADALDFAHRQGLVHRDVKPGNVIVQRDGRAIVTDFGIAKAVGDADLTRAGTIMGTARYLAPEQVDGEAVDGRADVYALGLVVWEMLAGRPAYVGDSELTIALARLHRDPPPIAGERTGVPAALSDAIAKATTRDPAQRTATASGLRDALLPYARNRDFVDDSPRTAIALDVPTNETPGAPKTVAIPRVDATAIASSIPPQPSPLPPRSRGGGTSILVGILALAIGIGAGYLGGHALFKKSSKAATATTAAHALVNLPITQAQDYDPEGDQHENPQEVKFVNDGNPNTAWQTEHYDSRDLGGRKHGVGIVFDLGASHHIGQIKLTTQAAGWDASIYVADKVGTDYTQWGPAVGSATNGNVAATITVNATGQYVLLWITRLPPSGVFGLAEITIAG
jgi:serine/threonine protein kinase